jgi:hypothetical protein
MTKPKWEHYYNIHIKPFVLESGQETARAYIHSLLEELIDEIPEDGLQVKGEEPDGAWWVGNVPAEVLKQQLREKYLGK